MRELIIKSEWSYEDFLEMCDLKDNDKSKKRWLLLIAEVNRNWSDSIDGEIREIIQNANEDIKDD